MNVGLILRNYDHLVKRLAFPTTSFLDEGTLGEQGDNEERGRNRIPDRTRSTRCECSSCGASIPANRTKCRFCLSNHLDGTSDDSRTPDTEWTLPTSSICSSRRRRSTPPSRRVLLGPHSSRRPIGIQRSTTASDLRPRYKARRTADRQMALAPRSSSSHL